MKFYYPQLLNITAYRGFLVCLLSCLLWSTPAQSNDQHWSELAKVIVSDLKDVQQAYQLGDIKAAQNSIIKGYFGVFEGKKMEAAMRMEIGAKHTYGVERMFGQLRKLTKKEDSAAEIARMITAMTQVLVDDASILDKAGIPPEVFRVNQ